MNAARDRLAGLLGVVGATGASSVRRTARPDDLRLEVRDVGTIAFPVPVRQAKQLCLVSRPARFGKGEQTLLDRNVRDTWEVPRSRIKIDKRNWDLTLRPTLERLQADLGLPPGCRLTAQFHAMLVYGPGQFFAPHQDSEKADTMIGTLVVMLPSDSQGGALVVEHGGTSTTYRPSKTSLSFVAFYADCRHEVRPVTAGYRVVLTYNLLLDGDTAASVAARVDPAVRQRLAGLLREHFSTRVPARYGDTDRDPPTRLVYLLDHEYTERGLSWARLKGADAHRAAALRAGADAAACEAVLALAEIHETWHAYAEPEPYRRRGYRWDDDDDDEYDDGLSGEPELQELIESTVRLDRWLISPDSPASPTSLTTDDDEVCATTPTVNLTPYASEYEGYMGNWGNTMDRWYRRAAIVVWPLRLAFAARAEASPEWALDTLAKRISACDITGARTAVATLAPFWDRSAGATQGEETLSKALTVARDLDEPELATLLLVPFRIETLAAAHAALAACIVTRYGEVWARDLVSAWFRENGRWPANGGNDRRAWLDSLPALCAALCGDSADGRFVATMLTERSWRWLRGEVDRSTRESLPSRREKLLSALGPSAAAVLMSAAACGSTGLRDEVIAWVSRETDDLLVFLMPALRSAVTIEPRVRLESGLDSIAEYCTKRLATRLARPARVADDWSVTPPTACNCALCTMLSTFLRDPTRRSYEWPLAERGRKHIHGIIDGAELPVTHHTRRQGRPYTLVLAKTVALFDRERQQREQETADLIWLDGTYRSGGRKTKARSSAGRGRPRA